MIWYYKRYIKSKSRWCVNLIKSCHFCFSSLQNHVLQNSNTYQKTIFQNQNSKSIHCSRIIAQNVHLTIWCYQFQWVRIKENNKRIAIRIYLRRLCKKHCRTLSSQFRWEHQILNPCKPIWGAFCNMLQLWVLINLLCSLNHLSPRA